MIRVDLGTERRIIHQLSAQMRCRMKGEICKDETEVASRAALHHLAEGQRAHI